METAGTIHSLKLAIGEARGTRNAVRRRAHRLRSREARAMTHALAMIALVLFTPPSRAEAQRVNIPEACRELANRAGLPLTLTPSEAARAVAYLRLMSSGDPAVQRCRQAVSRGKPG
ncbi:MAG: hypothetical protein ACLP7P_16955 [Rhodomicrobium sp.]